MAAFLALRRSADPEHASDRVPVVGHKAIGGLDRAVQAWKPPDERQRDKDRDGARDSQRGVAAAVPPALAVADVERPNQLAAPRIAR